MCPSRCRSHPTAWLPVIYRSLLGALPSPTFHHRESVPGSVPQRRRLRLSPHSGCLCPVRTPGRGLAAGGCGAARTLSALVAPSGSLLAAGSHSQPGTQRVLRGRRASASFLSRKTLAPRTRSASVLGRLWERTAPGPGAPVCKVRPLPALRASRLAAASTRGPPARGAPESPRAWERSCVPVSAGPGAHGSADSRYRPVLYW